MYNNYSVLYAGSEKYWKYLLFQFCAPGDYMCVYMYVYQHNDVCMYIHMYTV